ncbi:MAG: amino acid-binding protein [Desulfuromonas sp.]|nr:amino acid-binding protein [Desulfuromonas sp.]
MTIEQISIFIENKSGRLAEVAQSLGDNGVNIHALSLADTSDFGILRLIVDKTDLANDTLKKHGFTVSKTTVVAVEVPDHPSGLAGILNILDSGKVNVEYMYAFVERCRGNAVIIFRFDDHDAAIDILLKNNVNVLQGERVYNM